MVAEIIFHVCVIVINIITFASSIMQLIDMMNDPKEYTIGGKIASVFVAVASLYTVTYSILQLILLYFIIDCYL